MVPCVVFIVFEPVVPLVPLVVFEFEVAWNAFAPHAMFGPIASGLATPVFAYTPHW